MARQNGGAHVTHCCALLKLASRPLPFAVAMCILQTCLSVALPCIHVHDHILKRDAIDFRRFSAASLAPQSDLNARHKLQDPPGPLPRLSAFSLCGRGRADASSWSDGRATPTPTTHGSPRPTCSRTARSPPSSCASRAKAQGARCATAMRAPWRASCSIR